MVRLETPQEAYQAHSPFLGLAHEQLLLVVSSTDMKARVSSAYVKGLRKKSVSFPHSWCYNISTVLPAPTFLGGKLPFGTVCVEPANSAEGWVHTVSFSPSGDVLAFAGEPVLFFSIHVVLKMLPKITIASSASSVLDHGLRFVPSG